MGKYLKENEEENKNNNKMRTIFIHIGVGLLAVVAFVFSILIYFAIYFKAQNIVTAKDVAYSYGFIDINTVALKDYCSMSDYVPDKYINLFNKRFSNTINFTNSKITQSQKEQMIKLRFDKSYNFLEDEYNIYKKNKPNATKTDFCKSYDDNAEKYINVKVKIFKHDKPNMFKD